MPFGGCRGVDVVCRTQCMYHMLTDVGAVCCLVCVVGCVLFGLHYVWCDVYYLLRLVV